MKVHLYKNGFFEKWYRKADKRSQAKAIAMIEKVQNGDIGWCRPLKEKKIQGPMETKTRTGERVFWGRDKKILDKNENGIKLIEPLNLRQTR